MIFVTVGSSNKFDSLIKYMDNLSLSLPEEIIIQTGKSDYNPTNCAHFDFTDNILEYYLNADVIISHGGAGTCYEVLSLGKNLIGVENPHANDSHQWDLLKKLNEEGYIIWCRQIGEIQEALSSFRTHPFRTYHSPECIIHDVIISFINKGTP